MPRRSSATSLIISGTNRAQPAEVQFRYSIDAEGGAGDALSGSGSDCLGKVVN